MKQNFWFGPMLLLGIAVVMTPVILLAASGTGNGFDAVVHGIESRYQVHATRIPFMGLVSGIAGIATHGGVHGLHVAEIEHFEAPVDGEELNTLVEQRMGQGWQRMVRETSRGASGERGDQTLIYVRPDGSRVAMLIVDLDGHEMDVVQVSVNPDQLKDEIGKHRHGKDHDRSDDDGNQTSDNDSN